MAKTYPRGLVITTGLYLVLFLHIACLHFLGGNNYTLYTRTNATLGVRSNAYRILIHIVTTAMETDSIRITRLAYNYCDAANYPLESCPSNTHQTFIDPTCFSRPLPTMALSEHTVVGLECSQPTVQLYIAHCPAFKILHTASHLETDMQSSHGYHIEISRLRRFKQLPPLNQAS